MVPEPVSINQIDGISSSPHQPPAVKGECGCEQVKVSVTVQNADAGLLGGGSDQQVAELYAMLAALGQVAHRAQCRALER